MTKPKTYTFEASVLQNNRDIPAIFLIGYGVPLFFTVVSPKRATSIVTLVEEGGGGGGQEQLSVTKARESQPTGTQ